MSVHVNSAVFTMFFAFTVNSDKYACRLYKRKSPCPTNIYIGQVDISVQEYSIVLINSSFKIKEVIIYTLTTLTWDVETFDISN